jgi:Fe-S cluster assembly iron-binding protein IscA
MVQLKERAVTTAEEILDAQEPKPAGLRISVVGGGCSGFSYSMAFESQQNMLGKNRQVGRAVSVRRPGQRPVPR